VKLFETKSLKSYRQVQNDQLTDTYPALA